MGRTAVTAAAAVIILLAVGLGTPLTAEPIVIGETRTIASAILGEERELLVYLPAGYEDGTQNYPVLYLLDALSNFHHTTGTVQALARAGHSPDMIVVAVRNTDRTRDLTPTNVRRQAGEDGPDLPTSGGADAFLRFLREELIPQVEKDYRTAPFRILVGHSFGGLFAVHALLNAPNTFNATLAISPSLWWDDQLLVHRAQEVLAENSPIRQHLFLTLGEEGGDMMDGFQGMLDVLRFAAPDTLRWHSRILEGDDHGSAPIASTRLGLQFIFDGWRMPRSAFQDGYDAVEAHYRRLTARYGYPIPPPEGIVNNLGYFNLGEGHVDEAIRIFRKNVQSYPASANVYDSLGEALEAKGDLAGAREQYEKAVARAEASGDGNLGVFRLNLERVTVAGQ